MSELNERINEAISDIINEYLPEKVAPYVAWSNASNAFYVSTTDDEKYNGCISMSEIVDIFIEHHEHGSGGYIDERDAELLISNLLMAVKRIKSRVKLETIGDK